MHYIPQSESQETLINVTRTTTYRMPRNRSSPTRRSYRRTAHRSADSGSELLPRRPAQTYRRYSYSRDPSPVRSPSPSPSPSPTKQRPKRVPKSRAPSESDIATSKASSNALSADALAKLDALNHDVGWAAFGDGGGKAAKEKQRRRQYEYEYDEVYRATRETDWEDERPRRYREEDKERDGKDRRRRRSRGEHHQHRKKRRVVSGPLLEEGAGREHRSRGSDEKRVYEYRTQRRGGAASEDYEETVARRRRKRIWIAIGVFLLILAIVIPVAILLSKKNSSADAAVGGNMPSSTTKPANANLAGVSKDSIPQSAQGTVLDPFTWYDTTDFNVTYTDVTVGGLPTMGLNSTWDDSTKANRNVPALDGVWSYGYMPIRGMNVGGWLSLEPFITPSFFSGYNTHDNVVDEYTLTDKLGPSKAASTLERHYSSFVTEQTFADIQAAGFDHVRIPFSYWAVTTYSGDPYVPHISWRYLLRGIEWARKYGLRVNLDLHGAPGSQNGWNHSGRQGPINWLNGTNGALNGQRTLDIHDQLSKFFAQPRYKNIVTMYGLVNEPRMTALDKTTLLKWTTTAISLIRANNVSAVLVFGDGFMGLDKWQGQLQSADPLGKLLLDVHQYVIFNVDQIALRHSDKLNFACGGWTAQMLRSSDQATGFGPTMCGEWSQADTDCAQYLNNVGVGSRWEGTLNMASGPGSSNSGSVLNPTCPTKNNPKCECADANADPATYSPAYKQWLLQFAEAQMASFERGWGWFYWTWETETAVQWSWKLGLKAGIVPQKAFARDFNCTGSIPDYGALGLAENY